MKGNHNSQSKLVRETEVNYFLHRIKKMFPNFVAGVICDRNGFPVGSKISKRLWVHEHRLSLLAISNNKELLNDPDLVQLKLDIDKEKNYKIFVLLEKTKQYKNGMRTLKNIIKTQDLF